MAGSPSLVEAIVVGSKPRGKVSTLVGTDPLAGANPGVAKPGSMGMALAPGTAPPDLDALALQYGGPGSDIWRDVVGPMLKGDYGILDPAKRNSYLSKTGRKALNNG